MEVMATADKHTHTDTHTHTHTHTHTRYYYAGQGLVAGRQTKQWLTEYSINVIIGV